MATTECCERGAALWNFINSFNPGQTGPETRPPRRLLLVTRDDQFLDRRDKNVSLDAYMRRWGH